PLGTLLQRHYRRLRRRGAVAHNIYLRTRGCAPVVWGSAAGRCTPGGMMVVLPSYPRSYACCRPLMSIFFICSIACMTRFAFSGSLSPNIFPRAVGTICHDRPYLSCSQPH